MELLRAITSRRAVRSYEPRHVGEEDVRALLRAAVQAPSAMNEQPWLFAVVQDRARLKSYSDRAKALLLREPAPHGHFDGRPGTVRPMHNSGPSVRTMFDMLREDSFNVFYDAGTLVVIAARAKSPWTDADCWLAAQNLMLAACDRGLATCVIGFAQALLNTPEVKTELGLPPDASAVAPIVVGWPRASTTPYAVPRAEPRVVSWLRSGG